VTDVSRDPLSPGLGIPALNAISGEAVAEVLDSIPCAVLVVDSERRIRRLNREFRRALGLEDGSHIGSCQGGALGCLHAAREDHHRQPSAFCQDCELAALTTRALLGEHSARGRARLQIATQGRLEDVHLECSAVPVSVGEERFVVVLVENTGELLRLRAGEADGTVGGMIGRHPSMLELYDIIREVGPLDVPVLIEGETGTGKELVARALHRWSRRTEGLLVTVNCGALPDGLLESELFGHVKGAFTGAHRDKKGRFELADGGTIFLDEIGELSPAMQVKFLRVLQDGSFEPVGSERTVTADSRVVCATNRDLYRDLAGGRFRSDLYYRLCVVPIRVPSLRQRATDIPLLATHFLTRLGGDSTDLETSLTEEALRVLETHPWPGNVRELENAIHYAAIRARGLPIEPRHLPPNVVHHHGERPGLATRHALDPATVDQVLRETSGNRSEAAKRLGVSRTTLWRFLSGRSATHHGG